MRATPVAIPVSAARRRRRARPAGARGARAVCWSRPGLRCSVGLMQTRCHRALPLARRYACLLMGQRAPDDAMTFSREGLITQLVDFEGFTLKQATYGVDQTGL